jgi:hypothetical protein
MPGASPGSEHGYSGKPLVKKLGLKPEHSALVLHPPLNYLELMDSVAVPSADDPPKSGAFDFIHLFVRNLAELEKQLPKLEMRLADGGMIWVSWAKKSSPLFHEVIEDNVRAVALPLGLVDVKVCAIDADWSGLKLLRRKSAAAH